MTYFAVTYTYGAPEADLATRRAEHREYLAGLPELVVSGPWDDGRGALLVFRAESAVAVDGLVTRDPFVEAGFVADRAVHAWNPILGPLTEHL